MLLVDHLCFFISAGHSVRPAPSSESPVDFLAGQSEDGSTQQQYTQQFSLHFIHGFFRVSATPCLPSQAFSSASALARPQRQSFCTAPTSFKFQGRGWGRWPLVGGFLCSRRMSSGQSHEGAKAGRACFYKEGEEVHDGSCAAHPGFGPAGLFMVLMSLNHRNLGVRRNPKSHLPLES